MGHDNARLRLALGVVLAEVQRDDSHRSCRGRGGVAVARRLRARDVQRAPRSVHRHGASRHAVVHRPALVHPLSLQVPAAVEANKLHLVLEDRLALLLSHEEVGVVQPGVPQPIVCQKIVENKIGNTSPFRPSFDR